MANTPRNIIVHHSASTVAGLQTGLINDWHKERGFPPSNLGWYVGYHYVIERIGVLVQTREHIEIGAHTLGMNEKSIGICLAGDFDKEEPTEAQKGTLASLLSALCRRYQLDEYDIHPHRKYQKKSCYGAKLSDKWAAEIYLEHEIRRAHARAEEYFRS